MTKITINNRRASRNDLENTVLMKLGEKFVRVMFLKDYASFIKDTFVSELTGMNRNLMLSIDIVPVPTDEAVREVEKRLLGVETNITNYQRKQNQNNNFSAVIPYDMELQRKESREFLDDLTTRDQRMMFAVITMAIMADTKEQLDSDTETVLPVGVRKIDAFRTLTTESLAVFMPFRVQEIMDKGGICFGENAISHNLILCDRANLMNQSSWILGVPGGGKSMLAKLVIMSILLKTDDDVLIFDPEGEYGPMVEAMGDMGSVIHIVAGSRDRLNAMYMVEGYGDSNPAVVKRWCERSVGEIIAYLLLDCYQHNRVSGSDGMISVNICRKGAGMLLPVTKW